MTSNLKFQTVVLKAMAPLIRDFDYRVVEFGDASVRLDSQNASIHVIYDRHRSYEVSISFSDQENGILLRQIPFDLGIVYREFKVAEASRRSYFQSTDLEKIRAFLEATCALLLDHCSRILSGEPEAFSSLNERRRREAETYTQQLEIEAVRPQADEAWRNQRYEEFVSLLEEFREGLSDEERKKLHYALKKAAGH